jgi:hypothetical protein
MATFDDEKSGPSQSDREFKFPENRVESSAPADVSISERPDARRNFQQALVEVIERHPQLEAAFRRSLESPQIGEYHNEGEKMDSHLALIISTLNDIKSGNFPGEVEPATQAILREAALINDAKKGVQKVNPDMIDYTFMHDISKPDSLTVKAVGEKAGIEITWEQWQGIEKQGKPYKVTKPDGQAAEIASISYYHPSEGEKGQHGNKGAKSLQETPNISPIILTAIDKHEVAYQFGKINAATYEEHFVTPGYTDEQQKWIVTASYIDTMASLRTDGRPDLKNFTNLVRSRDNYLLIQSVLNTKAVIRDNDLQALKKQDRVLSRADIEKTIVKEKKYNFNMLRTELGLAVEQKQLSEIEREQVIDIVTTDPNSLGKKMGSKMKLLKPILQRCEIG